MTMTPAILGAGFIGRHLLRSLLSQGCVVSVLDEALCSAEFSSRTRWVQGSFMNRKDVARAIEGASVVYHLISSTVPGDAVDENEELFSNVVQTINLLRECVHQGVRRVVFISSASVYGRRRTLPIPEAAETDPISSHGIHKLTIEKYLQLYKYEFGIDCKIMRLSNPYGSGQNLYGRQGFISIVIGKLLSGGDIEIRGEGTAIRDFVHIDDVVWALRRLAVIESDESVFNIGSGQGVCLNDVVGLVQDILGKTVPVRRTDERMADIPASILDISKARRIMGFEPRISLRDGLQELLVHHGLLDASHPKGKD